MDLRSKRLASGLDPAARRFLDSTPEDALLLPDDVLGSLAHVAVLEDAKLLAAEEAAQLRAALQRLWHEARDGTFALDPAHEDVHMNVEARLTEELGALGKKLHTARSRNDQVALDLRLFARRWTLETASGVSAVHQALVALADRHPDAVLPGYTHLQVGQPVLLAFQLQAHAERFVRDFARFRDAYERLQVCPLGAGALAGTRHPIRPGLAAQLLGFDAAFANAMDAVSDRDYVCDLLFAASLTLTHASSLAEELVLFSSQEFGFATVGDAFATGSSLMPQKKNPDVFEVTRARAATLVGALAAALGTLRALPLAYNRDLQEQKRVFLQAYPPVAPHLKLLAAALGSVTFHPDRMLAAAEKGHGDATDLADYLVAKGLPFRDAHERAATLVRAALDKGVPLSQLPLADFQRVDPRVGADVLRHLGPRASVDAKRSPGSTGPDAVRVARASLDKRHAELERWWIQAGQRWESMTQSLLRPLAQERVK